jgi:Spy/CpxP family protein refolding chaperone
MSNMKKWIPCGAVFLLFLLVGSAFSQDDKIGSPTQNAQADGRGNILREIGLSPDQMRQLRRLNMERRPLMEEAQRQLREANRLLDDAIYADEVNDADVQSRLKEAQRAQAEVFRIRSTSELAIRKILTPDQLVRFRELRKVFEDEMRENVKRRRNQNRRNRDLGPGSNELKDGGKQPRPVGFQSQPRKHT